MTTPTSANITVNRAARTKKSFAAYLFILAIVASFFSVVSYHKAERGPDWRTIARTEVQAQHQAALQATRASTQARADAVPGASSPGVPAANRKPRL